MFTYHSVPQKSQFSKDPILSQKKSPNRAKVAREVTLTPCARRTGLGVTERVL